MSIFLSTMPPDLLRSIFELVPLKDLSTLASVNKEFHQFIPELVRPLFTMRMQNTRDTLLLEEKNIQVLKEAHYTSSSRLNVPKSIFISLYFLFDEYGRFNSLMDSRSSLDYLSKSNRFQRTFPSHTPQKSLFGIHAFSQIFDPISAGIHQWFFKIYAPGASPSAAHGTYMKMVETEILRHPRFCNEIGIPTGNLISEACYFDMNCLENDILDVKDDDAQFEPLSYTPEDEWETQ